MRRLHGLCAAALTALAVGCATTSTAPVNTASVPPDPATADSAPSSEALAPRVLTSGECGMYLWRANNDRPLVFFNEPEGRGAEIALNGQSIKLKLIDARGADLFGQKTEQSFSGKTRDGRVYSVLVSVETGPRFEDGIYIMHSAIQVAESGGFERVLPVIGVAGCRA